MTLTVLQRGSWLAKGDLSSASDNMGGMPSFTAGARWQCDNGEIRHSNYHGSGVSAALRKATLSPKRNITLWAACAAGMKIVT